MLPTGQDGEATQVNTVPALFHELENEVINSKVLMFTAPTAVRMWMSHGPAAPAKYDLSRLRLIACAGEPLNPEAHLWSEKHLVGQSGGMVVDNFWQTEIAAPVLGTLPTFEARPGKVGKPIPGVHAKVVDKDGRALPDGQGGLLVLRQPVPYMLRTVWGTTPGTGSTGSRSRAATRPATSPWGTPTAGSRSSAARTTS